MRAMVLEQPKAAEENPLQMRDVPQPTPGPGQVRVRVAYCGLCHTDLHTVEGDLSLPQLPLIPGHQIVGTVDAVGAGVGQLKEGDRVGVPWLFSACGFCSYCAAGNENLCDKARFTGYHVNGGYAESVIVSEAFACAIPEKFSDANAAPLLCAGIVGYRAYRTTQGRSGDRIGLYGFGASAHLVIQVARHRGREVYVFTRSEAHQQMAQRLGASWVGKAEDTPPNKLDAAIIFAPAGTLVPHALRVLRKGGRVVLAGIAMSQIPALDYALLYQERVLRSIANATRTDAREFMAAAAEIPVKTEVQTFDLEQANQALQALKNSRIEGAGVLKVS